MKATFRQVFVYNLDVFSTKKNAVVPTMADLASIIDRRRLAGRAHLSIAGGDADLTIGDLVIDPSDQTMTILFRHSDKHAADSVYSNIAADSFTSHAKANGEGGETGCHIFASLAPERGSVDRYTCVVEKVPNIDITLIRRFLSGIIHDEYNEDSSSFSYPSPTGQRTRAGTLAQERCLPRFDIEGQPSQHLARDVQQGRLTGITLTRAVTKTSIGGVAFLKKKEATLKIEVDQGSLSSNIWADVKKALAAEAATYPQATVGIRLPGRSKTVSVKVDSATGSPLTDLYVKSHDVWNINPPMAQSAKKVVKSLSDRVLPLLLGERTI